jgi:hypothetical protein
MNLIEGKDFTELLFKVTSQYEIRIKELENENARLNYLLNNSLLYKLERHIKALVKKAVLKMLGMVKQLVIYLGLKEKVKSTWLYQLLKTKLRGRI